MPASAAVVAGRKGARGCRYAPAAAASHKGVRQELARGNSFVQSSGDHAAAGSPWTRMRTRKRQPTRSAEAVASTAQLIKKPSLIIDPSHETSWVHKWDMVMVLALGFTATITPIEVAFLSEGAHITSLWWVNRAVDLAFLLDMLITFNMGYQEVPDRGGRWIFQRRRCPSGSHPGT